MLFSIPQHGEQIEVDGRGSEQFLDFLQDLAELFDLSGLPDENEVIIIDGAASLQLATFLQDACAAAGFTPPFEGEIIVEGGVPTFPFQTLLNNLAA